MSKLIFPISVGILSMSFTPLPEAGIVAAGHFVSAKVNSETYSLYNSIRLDQYGLSEEAFLYAVKGYEKLMCQNRITRGDYLTICDYSQSSRHKRLYIIDMANDKLLFNTYVAHGRNSGGEYATRFSNTPESLQSSLGFYITSNTYIGQHGLSLRINGMESGYNSKAYDRSIVIHGAAYVDASRARSAYGMGRSFGCPAVPQRESRKIINTIKNGTCLFIYHPSRNYLLNSKILND